MVLMDFIKKVLKSSSNVFIKYIEDFLSFFIYDRIKIINFNVKKIVLWIFPCKYLIIIATFGKYI